MDSATGPHRALLLAVPHDLGPGTSTYEYLGDGTSPTGGLGSLEPTWRDKNLNLQITPWLLPTPPRRLRAHPSRPFGVLAFLPLH